jgi:RNA polymerase sigma-70 factor (ECF subfamily)
MLANESSLIGRAQSGDLAAFNQLVLEYQGLAYSLALRTLQDADGAADATQKSFIKAYRAIGDFHGGSFKSWMMRIVVNTCYDELRSLQRRAADSLDDLAEDGEHTPYLVDRRESPQAHVERMELSALIELGIRLLPIEQRTVLVLCDVHGYAYEEIAEITELPMGTVKSRINRARTKLRDYLLQQPELLPSTFRPK